ncbi:Ferredoxin, 2Fe-2S [Euzebya pacifica]|jgi:3-phenylpropionate/trans-cinnamate dioxygenase ferredoxin subunit|uniref:Ferredoxin, 2Fe-2S n=1 Tax=Euzebya pacifica TaxID=1608957 RepID=A0A346Y024_9ACTN|nr:non-heme iron oxygenase ferredoxin subunit [Euzebya pacifica]AXV07821.1 Ferredoxin, 2Fe-2S [Euzebya pacifica]
MAFEKAIELDELKVGSAMQVELGGEPICLVRTDTDTVKAVHNICSHAFYELHEGWVDDNHIECGLHGSSFDLDSGRPDALPAVKPVPTYAVRVENGEVLVDASAPTNDATPSSF